MQSIKDINTASPEGKMLWAALIVLTQSPDVRILGQNIRGSNTEPDTMVKELNRLVEELGEDMPKPNSNMLPPAIYDIVASLKDDKSEGSYYHSWQSNIAMALMDEIKENSENTVAANKPYEIKRENLHDLVNNAAKRFLDNFISASK